MQFFADLLLLSGALGAAFYCFILSKRLSRLTNLDDGVGATVSLLAKRVDELSKLLAQAKDEAHKGTTTLGELTEQAEATAKHLELLLASMHDLPSPQEKIQKDAKFLRHLE
jgi:uncharacterized protein HemX